MASAAFFIACCVAAAASLAASADFLLKSSILDCCSLSLALKSATESFHQRDRLSRKPRFSAGVCGAAALGGAGGKPVGGELCGTVCCGPAADVAGPMEPAGDGGSLLCAITAAAKLQASNDSASKAPRMQCRAAGTVMLLLLPGVTATPPWPIHDQLRAVKRPPRHLLGNAKPGCEIGRQQGQNRRI